MVQCKKYSKSTAGNGTQRKTVIFTADIFTVLFCNLLTEIAHRRKFVQWLWLHYITNSQGQLVVIIIPQRFFRANKQLDIYTLWQKTDLYFNIIISYKNQTPFKQTDAFIKSWFFDFTFCKRQNWKLFFLTFPAYF